MEIVIKIPKEFEEHFNSDRFEDSLQRVRVDIHKSIIGNEFVLSGNYEIETLDMLTEAFLNGILLPEHHGRLIDADALMKLYGFEDATKYGNETAEQQTHSYDTMMMYEIADMLEDAQTIIEADGGEKDGEDSACD